MSEQPIPITLDGVPWTWGSIEAAGGGRETWPMLVDTGTVLTARKVPGGTSVETRNLFVHDKNMVPRARWSDFPLLETELGDVGPSERRLGIGGVLGGDLLQRFSLALDYAAPAIALKPGETACSCVLAAACEAVMPFPLAGGGTYALGDNVYLYPPTRVTVNACLEPVVDPSSRGVCCASPLPLGYSVEGAPGADVRMLVATGFHGVLLGASAYDRLCGSKERHLGKKCEKKAADLLAAAAPVEILLPGTSRPITRAAVINLGDPQGAPPLAALALVGRERSLSACEELARSRRLRADPASAKCDDTAQPPGVCLQVIPGGNCGGDTDRCNDRNQPAAAYIEIDTPIPVYLVEDTAAILQEVNFDVRPALSDVEGVIGTELLRRLKAQIDYPNRRLIARCAEGETGCRTYPRYACADGPAAVSDCGSEARALCNPPSSIVPGIACLPAPRDREGKPGPDGGMACMPPDGGM